MWPRARLPSGTRLRSRNSAKAKRVTTQPLGVVKEDCMEVRAARMTRKVLLVIRVLRVIRDRLQTV